MRPTLRISVLSGAITAFLPEMISNSLAGQRDRDRRRCP
jgi:hypothetical protein